MWFRRPDMAEVESALTGGDGQVLTDPPTSATSGADLPVGPSEPAAAIGYLPPIAVVGLDTGWMRFVR